MTAAQELADYLDAHIPLTTALGLDVAEASVSRVCLRAPLEPNRNHRGTAFGGSLVSLAIAAAWGLVWTRLRAEGRSARIVIQRNEMEYRLPVAGPFEAWAETPDDDAWATLTRALDRRGRGRVRIRVEVRSDGQLAGTFQGVFVAIADAAITPA